MSLFTGNGQDHGSTPTLINMIVTNSANLVQMSVAMHKVGMPFRGNYSPTALSAGVFVSQEEFIALKALLVGGAIIPISITVDPNNAVTQFCFVTTCISATVGLKAAKESLAPVSGVSTATTGATEPDATGTGG